MNLRVQLLRHPSDLEKALRDDGWLLEPGPSDSFCLRHSEVPDEGAARRRLYRLGLLTSGALRIELLGPSPLRPSPTRRPTLANY
jgi:hypothetical protein